MKRQFKKVLCLALIISVCAASFSSIGVLSAYAYSDTPGHWAHTVIDKWTASGIITGDGDGLFRPDDYITRAEFINVITSAKKCSDVRSINYSDVSQNDWFYLSLAKAAYADIISGYDDGTFRPNDNITREEAAVIIGRTYEVSSSYAARFSDSANISDWAAQYVSAMYANKIITGDSDGTFKPQMPITRAETIQIIDQAEQYSNSRTYSLTIFVPNMSPANTNGGKIRAGHDKELTGGFGANSPSE